MKIFSGNGAVARVVHVGVIALGVFAGLLLWTRLKIVTDTPRTVFADPKEHEASPSLQGGFMLDDSTEDVLPQVVAPGVEVPESSGPRTD